MSSEEKSIFVDDEIFTDQSMFQCIHGVFVACACPYCYRCDKKSSRRIFTRDGQGVVKRVVEAGS